MVERRARLYSTQSEEVVSLRARLIIQGDDLMFSMKRKIVLRHWYEFVCSVFALIYVARFTQTFFFGAEPFFIVESTFSA